MFTLEHNQGVDFLSVPGDQVDEAVARIKAALSTEKRECPRCGYVANASRWGLKTWLSSDPERVGLVLCCPACETRIDLRIHDVAK